MTVSVGSATKTFQNFYIGSKNRTNESGYAIHLFTNSKLNVLSVPGAVPGNNFHHEFNVSDEGYIDAVFVEN